MVDIQTLSDKIGYSTCSMQPAAKAFHRRIIKRSKVRTKIKKEIKRKSE